MGRELAYDIFSLGNLTICPDRGARPPLRGAIFIVGLSSAIGNYPSGHDTDEIRVSTSGAAESLRDPLTPNHTRVYINLICPRSMVEDHKKSESEDESVKIEVLKKRIVWLIAQNIRRSDEIESLYERVSALERALIDVKHTNTDDGSRHRNDGGWFD